MTRSLLAALALSALATPALAGDRLFAFSYGSSTLAEGRVDLEGHATWGAHSKDDHDLHDLELRQEVEYGLTNDTQVSIYLDQRYTNEDNGAGGRDKDFRFSGIDGEVIHTLTSSAEDGLGTAVYGEVEIRDRKINLEGKFLMEKQLGNDWTLVSNLVVEKAWEGSHAEESTLELGVSFGASYRINANWSAGAEARLEREYVFTHSEWETMETYVGPNVAWHQGRFFAVVTPMFQLSSVSDAPDYLTRVIAGVKF